MSIARAIRQHLPAAAQDALRNLVDNVSPARRRDKQARRRSVAESEGPYAALSPDGTILGGIFAGMRIPKHASWGGGTARLVGSYEQELVPELRRLIAEQPPRILDVGASEGYYAVGLARELPNADVYAFDIDREARRLCREAARLNSVKNVTVLGRADVRRIRRLLVPGALLISDCEGYEAVLLDPQVVPVLRESRLLVELHEFAVPGVTDLILSRFADSHTVTIIDAQPRSGADYPQLAAFPAEQAQGAVDEGRPIEPHPMQWAVLRPHQIAEPQP